MFPCNTGVLDRAIRGAIGSATLGAGVYLSSYLLVGLGALPFLTGASGFCPLYALLGLDSGCRREW